MNRKEVENILKKIESTNTLDMGDEIEYRFYRVYKGLLFKEVIPPRKQYEGLFKLTHKGKSLIM